MGRLKLLSVMLLLCAGLNAQKVPVLSTVSMVEDLVRQVGGEHIESRCLIANGLDPHNYTLVKGDGERIDAAHVVFYGGLGLEHNPSLLRKLERHPNGLSLGGHLQAQNPNWIVFVDGQPDPHVWSDVGLWARCVDPIVERLAAADPLHEADFRANGLRLRTQLEQLDRQILEQMAQIPDEKRFLVSSHSAFNYFVRAYLAGDAERESGAWRRRCEAPEGISPEAEMSLSDIRRVVDFAMAHQVGVLFLESNVSAEPLNKVADVLRHQGHSVVLTEPLYSDAMAPGGSYAQMAQHNAQLIQTHLGVR